MKSFGSCSTISVPISIVKPGEEDADDSSPLTSLPDDIILQILHKITDLKTLCFCYLVSKRFSSVVFQVDSVSFTAPLFKSPEKNFFRDVDCNKSPRNLFRRLINGLGFKPLSLLRDIVGPIKPPPPIISSLYSQSFRSAITFLTKFTGVKSLSIELPNCRHMLRWTSKYGSRIESLFFILPDSISETNQFHANEEGMDDKIRQKLQRAVECIYDLIMKHRILWIMAKELPMLEEAFFTMLGEREMHSFSGEKLNELKKEWALSELHSIGIPSGLKHWYIPVLNLPVSGYVMKGVTLIVMEMNGFQVGIGNDDLGTSEDEFEDDGFEDKENDAYVEAVTEILENHKSKMKVLPLYEH